MWWFLLAVVLFLLVFHAFLPKSYHTWSFEKKVNKIPGPPTIPFFGSIQALNITNESFLEVILRLVNDYNPLLRVVLLGHNTVMTTNVDDVEVLLNTKSHITKSDDYYLLHPWLGTGLLTSTDAKWFSHRRMLTPAFHFGILEQYVEIFSRHARTFQEILASANGKNVEINPLASLCTLDIICETAMGIFVNAQRGGTQDYVKAVLEMSELFQIRLLSPWMYNPFTFPLFHAGRRHKKVLKVLHGFTNKVIEEKTQSFKNSRKNDLTPDEVEFGAKKKRSFLDLLVEISEVEGKLTREEIREEVDTFMFEGHDTTAAAISWALFELSLNPEIQAKAQAEQDEIFGDSDREPNTSDIAEMKYLEQIIKETLRIYPSVPIISRKLEQSLTLSGYEVPAGVNAAIFIFYIHRDPRLYPQPEKFDPDRFLPERIAKRHPYSYIPFSAGPRNCIGQKFALMEEKVVLSHILRKLNIHPVTNREDLHLMAELILRPKENLRMTFTPRVHH